MPALHNPSLPRHARMFELLRQSHQADLTSERLRQAFARQTARENVQVWRTEAIQSFQTPRTEQVLKKRA